MLLLAALLATIMGLTLGLLGGGGSILTVPILVYILDVPDKTAIAMSLLVVGTTSAFAMLSHARQGNVIWRTGLIFGVFGMIGAFLGGQIAKLIPGSVLLMLFALLMLITGAAMLRPKRDASADEPSDAPPKELPVAKVAAEGVVVGAVTGLVGAGGGFLVVPALVLMGGLSMKRAIGTSLLVIAMKSFAGFASFASFVTIDWSLFSVFTGAALVGTIAGTQLARRIDASKLREGFAIFVFIMAAVMISRELATPIWFTAVLAAVTLVTTTLISRHLRARAASPSDDADADAILSTTDAKTA
jgi:uncharacterized membrane protein YfcA